MQSFNIKSLLLRRHQRQLLPTIHSVKPLYYYSSLIKLVFLCVAVFALMPAISRAQTNTDPDSLLESARKDMETVRATQNDSLNESATRDLRNRALSAQTNAEAAANIMVPELTEIQARLAQLKTPSEGVKESPEVANQRTQLLKQLSALDSQIKLARLLAVEAEQAAATALERRRSEFSARLGERAPIVVGSDFWTELVKNMPSDLNRMSILGDELQKASAAVSFTAWLGIACAVIIFLVLKIWLNRILLHLISTRVPQGRLRRSLYAVCTLVLVLLIPGLISHALFMGLHSGGALSIRLIKFLDSVEPILWFAGFVAGLGKALLMPRKPSWRLPPISDVAAVKLRWFPLLFAIAIVIGWGSSRLSLIIDASTITTSAITGLSSLTFTLILAFALIRLRHKKNEIESTSSGVKETVDEKTSPPVVFPLWLTTLRTGFWLAIFFSLIAFMAGYVVLGNFVIGQLVWGLIVFGTAYLLSLTVDDLFMTLLVPISLRLVDLDNHAHGDNKSVPAHQTREQAAVLISGLSRFLIGLFAVILLMAPYGEGPLELFRRASRVTEGLAIGEISLNPAALFNAALVLIFGLFAIRMIKEWLAKRYMPTTRMDAGMQMSVGTLFGYAGSIVVVALSMSAMGVSLERVAWVASALSVGIGFGLQAVVQNFVSGLILLAERPVKVGDWVSLAGIEGDIRRINVRATEIQMSDRSTVIVPNSEFITKVVRNVTYTDPLGMVNIKIPMPLSTDAHKAVAVMLDALQAHPGVLDAPTPTVQLDGIDGGNLIFNVSAFVSSPRASYGVKSDLLFDVLERLREANLPLGTPPTMLLSQPSAI